MPAQRSNAAGLRLKIILVLGSLVFSALMGLFAGVAYLTQKPAAVDPSAAFPQSKGFAEAVARGYFTGLPLSVPAVPGLEPASLNNGAGLRINTLAWDNFSPLTYNGTTFEVNNFIAVVESVAVTATETTPAVAGHTSVLNVSVTTLLTATGPVLAASPYLSPLSAGASSDKFDGIGGPLGIEAVQVPGPVRTNIGKWAAAYAAGGDDGERTLQDLSGDSRTDVRYPGLGGFTLDSAPNIVSAYESNGSAGNQLVVRARIRLKSANGSVLDTALDLIVLDYVNSATPKIVAWGSPGLGPYLAPQVNAVSK